MAMRLWLVLVVVLVSGVAEAKVVRRVQPLKSLTAIADYTSDSFDTSSALSGSLHCKWASIGGTPDATFTLEVSNDDGATWVAKSGGVITMSGASGSGAVSLAGVVTEGAYHVKYAKNSVTTTGTVNCYALFKE